MGRAIRPPTGPPARPSICLIPWAVQSVRPLVLPPISPRCPPARPSAHLRPPALQSARPPALPSNRPLVRPPVRSSVRSSVCPQARLSAMTSASPPAGLTTRLLIYPTSRLPYVHPSTLLPAIRQLTDALCLVLGEHLTTVNEGQSASFPPFTGGSYDALMKGLARQHRN